MSARVRAGFGAIGTPVRILLLGALSAYRRVVSPLLGPRCRFHPTCSAYAEEAIRAYGVARGLRLAVWRLLRCHPWSAGGFEPVPPPGRGVAKPSAYGKIIHSREPKVA